MLSSLSKDNGKVDAPHGVNIRICFNVICVCACLQLLLEHTFNYYIVIVLCSVSPNVKNGTHRNSQIGCFLISSRSALNVLPVIDPGNTETANSYQEN